MILNGPNKKNSEAARSVRPVSVFSPAQFLVTSFVAKECAIVREDRGPFSQSCPVCFLNASVKFVKRQYAACCSRLSIHRQPLRLPPDLALDYAPIIRSKRKKLRGVPLRPSFNFFPHSHTSEVLSNARHMLGFVEQVSTAASLKVLECFLPELVLPQPEYCSSGWSVMHAASTVSLESVQRQATNHLHDLTSPITTTPSSLTGRRHLFSAQKWRTETPFNSKTVCLASSRGGPQNPLLGTTERQKCT